MKNFINRLNRGAKVVAAAGAFFGAAEGVDAQSRQTGSEVQQTVGALAAEKAASPSVDNESGASEQNDALPPLAKQWRKGEPFDMDQWKGKLTPPSVEFKDNTIHICGRGVAVSKIQYPKGAIMQGTLIWDHELSRKTLIGNRIDPDDKDAVKQFYAHPAVKDHLEKYPDHPCIILRTDAKQLVWPGEVGNGVKIYFNPATSSVDIVHDQTPENGKPADLKRASLTNEPLKIELPKGKPISYHVVDDGDTITVTVNGKTIKTTKELPDTGASYVAFSNRENLAGVNNRLETTVKMWPYKQ